MLLYRRTFTPQLFHGQLRVIVCVELSYTVTYHPMTIPLSANSELDPQFCNPINRRRGIWRVKSVAVKQNSLVSALLGCLSAHALSQYPKNLRTLA